MDKGLIEQADLLIESLEPRFDDLVDDIRRFSLRLVLVGKDLLLPPNDIGIERGSIDRLRIGRGDVHCHHASKAGKLVGLSGRLQRHDHPDLAQALVDGVVNITGNHAIADRQARCPPQRHVLTDFGNRLGNSLGHANRANLGRQNLLEINR